MAKLIKWILFLVVNAVNSALVYFIIKYTPPLVAGAISFIILFVLWAWGKPSLDDSFLPRARGSDAQGEDSIG